MTDLVFLAIGFVAGYLVHAFTPQIKAMLKKQDGGGPGSTTTPP